MTVATQTRPKVSEISPHGGGLLVNRIVSEKEVAVVRQRARGLKSVALGPRELSDLEMIAIGALSPLEGFMGQADYESVLNTMHLKNGVPWSIPITLSVSEEVAKGISTGQEITLANDAGEAIGLMEVTEIYGFDKQREAELIYKTTEDKHPGVAAMYAGGTLNLAGPIWLIERKKQDTFRPYRLDPAETRALFKEKGWRRIVAFQTRNPIHRAHEYLQKCALEITDGLLIHPIVGETKGDDVPAHVRMECYEALMQGYFPKDRVVLAVNPAAMRYAGPREAIFHAIIRRNYGCTHFIVGRDHAGVGNYYGTYDAHHIFDNFDPAALGITPLFFDHSFFCTKCEGMQSSKTCCHGKEDHIFLSGTKVREMLGKGEIPPLEFTRPEVAKILIAWYKKAG